MEDETSSIASSSKPYFGKAHKKPKNNKIPKNEIKKEQNQESEEENEQVTTTTQPLQNNQPPPEFISFQKTWSEHFIVELTRLPGKMDDTEIEELFKKFNPSACFFYDPDEETKQREARACFADRHVAIKCCTKLHKKRVKGCGFKVLRHGTIVLLKMLKNLYNKPNSLPSLYQSYPKNQTPQVSKFQLEF